MALPPPPLLTPGFPTLACPAGLRLQFAQWANDLSFRLFDYGSAAANRRHYGRDRPPSLAGGVGACKAAFKGGSRVWFKGWHVAACLPTRSLAAAWLKGSLTQAAPSSSQPPMQPPPPVPIPVARQLPPAGRARRPACGRPGRHHQPRLRDGACAAAAPGGSALLLPHPASGPHGGWPPAVEGAGDRGWVRQDVAAGAAGSAGLVERAAAGALEGQVRQWPGSQWLSSKFALLFAAGPHVCGAGRHPPLCAQQAAEPTVNADSCQPSGRSWAKQSCAACVTRRQCRKATPVSPPTRKLATERHACQPSHSSLPPS